MPASIPQTDPTILTAGSSWWWDRYVADYLPADGWSLHYALRGAGSLDIEANANLSGTGYEVRVSAAETSALPAGTYRMLGYVEKDGDQFDVVSGSVVIRANLREIDGSEGRSHYEIVLELIRARIAGRLPADRESFQINGQSITRIPLLELVQLERRYEMLTLFDRDASMKPVSHRAVFGAIR